LEGEKEQALGWTAGGLPMAHQRLKHTTARLLPAALAVLALAMSAAADEPTVSKITLHQVVQCMMKRLKSDRTESYQAAFRTCKQELEAAQPELRGDTAMNTAESSETPKQ
jgi:CTP:molybdopterin cytidylyltransferase MocA